MKILNSDLIQKYIALITGLTVFVLTSIYNHWKDRSVFVKQTDTSFNFRYAMLNAVNPKDEKLTEGKQSLLINRNSRELAEHGKEKPDFKVRYLIMENIGENMVFDIRLKARLYRAKNLYHIRKNMDKKEVFYIPIGGLSTRSQSLTYFVVKYKSSSGLKYKIINFNLRKKIKNIDIKYKNFAGIFWIPQELRIYHQKYNSRYKIL